MILPEAILSSLECLSYNVLDISHHRPSYFEHAHELNWNCGTVIQRDGEYKGERSCQEGRNTRIQKVLSSSPERLAFGLRLPQCMSM